MKTVRTFATSANVGPGFDTLGICFDIYNEYEYSLNSYYKLEGFKDYYNNPKNNLIIKSYEETFKKYKKELKYIYLKETVQNIPTSRGLGSSASCIVCGVMIANDILGNVMNKEDIFQLASDIEGHPDNVAPLVFGGFTSSFKENKYYKVDLKINENYKFMVCIPPFPLSTKLARSVLPKKVEMKDAVYNISHAVAMIKALEIGDMNLLKIAKNDKLHEEFRYKLIEKSDVVIDYANNNNSVCLISGAGSTLLMISTDDIVPIKELDEWEFVEVKISKIGAYIYEKK